MDIGGGLMRGGNYLFNKLVVPYFGSPEYWHNKAIFKSAKLEYNQRILDFVSNATYVPGEEDLEFSIGDLKFPNPVGLAAGFVKEPIGLKFWEAFGFGSITIGGITGESQPGNQKPRIFTFNDGVVNGMGLRGKGVIDVRDMLSKRQQEAMMPRVPLGANLCNSASTKPEDKIDEFKQEMLLLYPYIDYFEINISCPNQVGVCGLQTELNNILQELTKYNKILALKYGVPRKKLFVKISPLTQNPDNPEDGTIDGLKSIADICNEFKYEGVDAVIATNTAKEHNHKDKTRILTPNGDTITGGASGKQIQSTSLETVRELRKVLDGSIPIIGVGGIGYDKKGQEGQSAINMIEVGAESVQLYSAFVQESVMVVYDIKEALIKNNGK